MAVVAPDAAATAPETAEAAAVVVAGVTTATCAAAAALPRSPYAGALGPKTQQQQTAAVLRCIGTFSVRWKAANAERCFVKQSHLWGFRI